MTVKVHVIYQKGRNLYLRYVDPETGKQHTRTSGTSDSRLAERKAGEWEREVNEGKFAAEGNTSWAEFRKRYEDQVLSGLAESTAKKSRTVLSRLEKFAKPKRVSAVNFSVIQKFLADLRKKGAEEATIQSYSGHIRAAMNWAAESSMTPPVRFKKVKRAKKTTGTPMKGRPLTEEELDRIIEAIPAVLSRLQRGTGTVSSQGKLKSNRGININPADWEFYLRGMWLSGLRLEESLDFWWDREDKLHLFNGMLRIHGEDEKGNLDRLLPLTPDFVELLESVPKAQRTGRVFRICPDFKTAKDTVGRIAGRFGKEAGVVVNARTGKHASLHDFRRTFGERWAMKVMPHILMQLMRHESIETTMRFYAGRNALKVMEELKKLT